MTPDLEALRDVAAAVASQESLDAWLAELEPRDPAAPSLLAGWTLGHVLTHIARNADSHRSMLAGEPQYPGGTAQRERDIEAGAGRPWDALVADVHDANVALAQEWEACDDWSGTVRTSGSPRPLALMPFRRQREVEVHRADLGLGYTFADMPTEYVRRDLSALEMLWRASKPMGLTPLPERALAAPPSLRLAWLLGRAEIDGLPPAGIY